MKRFSLLSLFALCGIFANAQLNPAITNWLRNTTGIMGRHYVNGNSTPINDADSANVQSVLYSTNWVYVRTKGIPGYITGPFLDGNPSLASNQNAIFKISLNPTQNTGTPTNTTGGNIGILINGVAIFDYRDGVSWKSSTNALAGGPIGGMGDNVWNRDAILAEKGGFDCAKGHPAMGNYHHHQNPSAFDLDLSVISTVCNLYDADGLYVIDSTQHAPLLGYAYDGFPVYGAYGYKNVDGTGGIARMKSSYQLRNITVRTHYADGTDVIDGPAVNSTYPLGLFREDYEYVPTSSGTPDYLDEHNGRFCVTPEYPAGIYAYFCTVDANWNSFYPYIVGPTFYGNKTAVKVTSISEAVTLYTGSASAINEENIDALKVNVFPNPASELVAIQVSNLNRNNLDVELFDITGKLIQKTVMVQGSTIVFFDTQTLYSGEYLIRISDGNDMVTKKVILTK
jgi:YHYH protein/Secretion system C-terminal sorting domain